MTNIKHHHLRFGKRSSHTRPMSSENMEAARLASSGEASPLRHSIPALLLTARRHTEHPAYMLRSYASYDDEY